MRKIKEITVMTEGNIWWRVEKNQHDENDTDREVLNRFLVMTFVPAYSVGGNKVHLFSSRIIAVKIIRESEDR